MPVWCDEVCAEPKRSLRDHDHQYTAAFEEVPFVIHDYHRTPAQNVPPTPIDKRSDKVEVTDYEEVEYPNTCSSKECLKTSAEKARARLNRREK